jgi:acyl carrier protein
MDRTSTTLEDVKSVVVSTLGIEDRAEALTPSTPLLGALPELDSMAVVELVTALEARFGFEVSDDEITGDVFETLGSLAAFVDAKLPLASE